MEEPLIASQPSHVDEKAAVTVPITELASRGRGGAYSPASAVPPASSRGRGWMISRRLPVRFHPARFNP